MLVAEGKPKFFHNCRHHTLNPLHGHGQEIRRLLYLLIIVILLGLVGVDCEDIILRVKHLPLVGTALLSIVHSKHGKQIFPSLIDNLYLIAIHIATVHFLPLWSEEMAWLL